MKKTKQVIFFLPLAASAVFFAAGEVRSQVVTEAVVAPRVCSNLSLGNGKFVTITAGPGPADTPFPQIAPCPDGPESCLKWEYLFSTSAPTVSLAYTLLTAPSDLEIITNSSPPVIVNAPGVNDSKFKVGNKIFDVRALRYAASGTSFLASYYTRNTGVGIGNITAGALTAQGGERESDDDSRNNTALCAITGPTTPQTFAGSPVANITSTICFTNGCCYEATAGARDNIVISMTAVTANATVPPYEACTVTNIADICESELNVSFCPPLELGRPPLQGEAGGICYAPPNIKFAC